MKDRVIESTQYPVWLLGLTSLTQRTRGFQRTNGFRQRLLLPTYARDGAVQLDTGRCFLERAGGLHRGSRTDFQAVLIEPLRRAPDIIPVPLKNLLVISEPLFTVPIARDEVRSILRLMDFVHHTLIVLKETLEEIGSLDVGTKVDGFLAGEGCDNLIRVVLLLIGGGVVPVLPDWTETVAASLAATAPTRPSEGSESTSALTLSFALSSGLAATLLARTFA